MLTGAAPFSGETMSALMFQTINFIPPAPSTVNSAVPPMLDFIVAKTLAKKREERYQDARELASDLRECLAQLRLVKTGTKPDTPQQPSEAGQPVLSLIDADARSQLLAGAVQMTRVTDADKDDAAAAPTLGISRTFDSLEATQRLAAQTGMAREFGDYAATLKIPAAVAAVPTPAAITMLSAPELRLASAPQEPPKGGWGRREWWSLGLGLASAMVIAAAIAYL